MPEYLSKEEVRQWRSSLERITLEEYAQRLGKVISEEKETNDIVDIVLKNSSVEDDSPLTTFSQSQVKAERITSLAQQAFEREQEISDVRLSKEVIRQQESSSKSAAVHNRPAKKVEKAAEKIIAKAVEKAKPALKKETKELHQTKEIKEFRDTSASEDIRLTFKKNLTPREQAVFEHFLNNRNNIVYAKELAQVLELPRDYVYKYIKNLRAKLNEDALHNADNGGFVLNV